MNGLGATITSGIYAYQLAASQVKRFSGCSRITPRERVLRPSKTIGRGRDALRSRERGKNRPVVKLVSSIP